jgi:glycosyltransferase involved in cell wall biosynthesis
MCAHSPPTLNEQSSKILKKNNPVPLTFVIITKDHSQQIKKLIDSIIEANLSSFSLVLIDDSDVSSFAKTQRILEASPIPFQHLSSDQAIKLVKPTLEKVSLSKDESSFVRNCIGIEPAFRGFVERFFKRTDSKSASHLSQRFAPYSIARNLGICTAVISFRPRIIVFLDDDCEVPGTVALSDHVNLIGSRLKRDMIVAVSGIYSGLEGIPKKTHAIESIITAIRRMNVFLEKSLSLGASRFQVNPPHMLGGALILGYRVFGHLPFDPYIARGEDHMYALDLASTISQEEVFVRDSTLIIHHRGHRSREKMELNVLRDIFRFMYCRTKTGRSFIPFFLIRWITASLVDFLLCSHDFKKCKLQLFTLLYIGHKFARTKRNLYRDNVRAWRSLVTQMATSTNTQS